MMLFSCNLAFSCGKNALDKMFHIVPCYFINSRSFCNSYHKSPLFHLNQLCDGQLLKTNQSIFQPTEKDIAGASKLFSYNPRYHIISHKGVVNMKDLPVLSYPEVTFAGRSNCGKSSLMKYIFREIPNLKLLAVSKKPGHTKVLKFYQVGHYFTLVDQPGYGENMPEHYFETVEQYLTIRRNLRFVFLLIDCITGISDSDMLGLNMMEEHGNPYAIVYTKVDLLSHHALIRKIVDLQKFLEKHNLPNCLPQPFLVSSKTGTGIQFLQTFIAYVTGNLRLESE